MNCSSEEIEIASSVVVDASASSVSGGCGVGIVGVGGGSFPVAPRTIVVHSSPNILASNENQQPKFEIINYVDNHASKYL